MRAWIGKSWGVESRDGSLEGSRVEAKLRWIPQIDALELQVASVAPDGGAERLWEVVLYHHPGLEELRCFALSASGEVATGEVRVLEENEVELELEEETSARTIARRVWIRRGPGGEIQLSLSGAGEEPRQLYALHEQ